jgi:hypothetical protein
MGKLIDKGAIKAAKEARRAARRPVPFVCNYLPGERLASDDGEYEVVEVIPADRDGGDHHVAVRPIRGGPAMTRLAREHGVLLDGGQGKWARRLATEVT